MGQGIEKRVEQGKIEISQKLLSVMNNGQIAKVTGLTTEMIPDLRKAM